MHSNRINPSVKDCIVFVYVSRAYYDASHDKNPAKLGEAQLRIHCLHGMLIEVRSVLHTSALWKLLWGCHVSLGPHVNIDQLFSPRVSNYCN